MAFVLRKPNPDPNPNPNPASVFQEGHRLDASAMNCVTAILTAHSVTLFASLFFDLREEKEDYVLSGCPWGGIASITHFRGSLALFLSFTLLGPNLCSIFCGPHIDVTSSCCGADLYGYLMVIFMGLGVVLILISEIYLAWRLHDISLLWRRPHNQWGYLSILMFGIGFLFQPG